MSANQPRGEGRNDQTCTVCFIQNTPGSIGSCPNVWILVSSSVRLVAITPAQGKSSATALTPEGTKVRSYIATDVRKNTAIEWTGDIYPDRAPRHPVRTHLESGPDPLVDRLQMPTTNNVQRQELLERCRTMMMDPNCESRTELNT